MPPMTAQDEDLSTYINRTRGSLEEALEAIFKNCGKTLVSILFTECNLMITDKYVHYLFIRHCLYRVCMLFLQDTVAVEYTLSKREVAQLFQ